MREIPRAHNLDPLDPSPAVEVLGREQFARGNGKMRMDVEVGEEFHGGKLGRERTNVNTDSSSGEKLESPLEGATHFIRLSKMIFDNSSSASHLCIQLGELPLHLKRNRSRKNQDKE
jgi:hypothetical protein